MESVKFWETAQDWLQLFTVFEMAAQHPSSIPDSLLWNYYGLQGTYVSWEPGSFPVASHCSQGPGHYSTMSCWASQITLYLLKTKTKKTDSLELLQFTFFLGIHDFFWCLSTHHDLACLPKSCLGFSDVSSPHSLLQELPTSFGVQKILEQPKLARCQETRPLLSAQHLTHEPLRVSESWGRIPGRCVALE